MLCLAGFRDKLAGRTESVAPTGRRPSIFGSRGGEELRIHLELDSPILQAMLPDRSEVGQAY